MAIMKGTKGAFAEKKKPFWSEWDSSRAQTVFYLQVLFQEKRYEVIMQEKRSRDGEIGFTESGSR